MVDNFLSENIIASQFNYMLVSDDAGTNFIIDYDEDAEMVFTLIESFEELVDAEEHLRLLEIGEYKFS